MAKKRYSSVSTMLHDLSGDNQFNKGFDERLMQRRLVKHLIALRSAKDVSQADVANALGVTQSRVSKIENGVDDDLRFSDLKAYAKAFDMDIGIIFADRNRTIVDEVKFHVFQVKHLLDQLAKFAKRDEGIARGVATFFGEAFFNVVRMMQDSASKLPEREGEGRPRICIQIQQSPMEEGDNDSPNESDIPNAADEATSNTVLS